MITDQDFETLEPKLLHILKSGGTFYGKFTCGHCGSRQTFVDPNVLYASGICEECQQVTDLNKWGLFVIFSPHLDEQINLKVDKLDKQINLKVDKKVDKVML